MAVGYGLPWWLPIGYLTADETRALGAQSYSRPDGRCAICTKAPATDWAHIIRKGMGGRGDGIEGPTVALCRPCHTGPEGIDRTGYTCLAVTEAGRLDYLAEHDGEVLSRPIGWFGRVC